MYSVAQEINNALLYSTLSDEEYLAHYGTPRHSGRYPWGSGKDPYQHTRDLLSRVEELKKKGWTETPENILKEFGLTTTQYRAQKSLAKDLRRMDNVDAAKSLAKDGLGPTEIAKKMSERLGEKINESTVRSWLDSEAEARTRKAMETADFIREQIESKGIIDVGGGVEHELGISKEKLNQALEILKSEGYQVQNGGIPQVTNLNQQTITRVIGPKDMEKKDFYDFKTGSLNIHSLNEYISRDGGETYEKKFHYPESMDSSRLKIVLGDEVGPDGTLGVEKDGLIQIRRGVKDLDLGESHYAQVRILVDHDKYIKGMAVYSDNMPDGIDVVFNSNKKSYDKALKSIKDDPDNPFGSTIKDAEQGGQYWYTDSDGTKKLGLINKARMEGDWNKWSDTLPAQFLSKQPLQMARRQLKLTQLDKQAEYEDILAINNPTIKKHFLDKFADECDAAAVDLKAAALPGQKYHVIIPIPSLSDKEVYAPDYPEGSKLALIRYPHGGTFEIPILTVTHRNKDAANILGKNTVDVVGINKSVADRLSGADFDGDTVMCIPTHDPNGSVKVKSTHPLKGLEGFDTRDSYGADEERTDANGNVHYYRNGIEYKTMKDTQKQMGVITNLITDMTLMGASEDKLARAVRHSMVVIDAEKHHLDYKQSERDNDINSLKKEFQNGGGAATLISRASGEKTVTKRQGSPKVNLKDSPDYDLNRPEGALIWKTADDAYYTITKTNKRTGEVTTSVETRHEKTTNMGDADDPHSLVSTAKTDIEILYANHATYLKDLANKARVESAYSGKIAYSSKAKEQYSAEVKSLMDKLSVAELNRPRERQAMLMANVVVANKQSAMREKLRSQNPDLSEKELSALVRKSVDVKKEGQRALSAARTQVESVSRRNRSIVVTDREWEAIQAGAISESYLKRILNNSDIDSLREKATPKTVRTITPAKVAKIKAMSSSHYSIAEIASSMHLSATTISKYLNDDVA